MLQAYRQLRKAKQSENEGLIAPSKVSYNVKRIMERHQLKHASIQFRHDMIQKQNRINYQNEHDRLTGILNNKIILGLRPADMARLTNRQQELKQLHQQSVYPDNHEIYRK